jgi:excisionase family DNA binding protein
MTDRLIPVAAAAKRLSVCPETIRRWVRTGRLPVVRYPSGQYRIASETIDRILQQSAQPTTPPTSAE